MKANSRSVSPAGTFAIVALAVGAIGLLGPDRAQAQSSIPREETWVTNGSVHAIIAAGKTVYIGGGVSYVGPNTGSGVPLNAATGQPVARFPRVNGRVLACASDGTGGWYIGGDFTRVGALTRNRIAHILSDGSVDATYNPNANKTVYALAVSGSTVYAGGLFSSCCGMSFSHG